MQNVVNRTQEHALLTYAIFTVINYNLVCGTMLRKPQFSYPRKDYEMRTRLQQNRNILRSLIDGCNPHIARKYTVRDAALDLVPNLTSIVSPKIRNVCDTHSCSFASNFFSIYISA